MKALPMWQPWASLVALGAKRVETRGYPPSRLGLHPGQRIAIHATKRATELWLCEYDYFCEYVLDPDALPLGALIATCTIARAVGITETTPAFLRAKDPQEYAFGNYAIGRWAWVLADVAPLPAPVPFKGSQGAFDVPDHLLGVDVATNSGHAR